MMHSSRHEDDGFADRGRRSDDDALSTPRVAALNTIKDFEVADGTPDPRGWTVIDSMRMDVGKVHDLIVDTVAMRTRYLDVELDKDATRLKDERHVLIPVGLARLDDVHDRVVLGSLIATQLVALPSFTHQAIDRDYESSLLRSFETDALAVTNAVDTGTATRATPFEPASPGTTEESTAPESRDFYDTRHFDERSFFGGRKQEEAVASNRPGQADSATIRKRGESRVVTEPATTSR